MNRAGTPKDSERGMQLNWFLVFGIALVTIACGVGFVTSLVPRIRHRTRDDRLRSRVRHLASSHGLPIPRPFERACDHLAPLCAGQDAHDLPGACLGHRLRAHRDSRGSQGLPHPRERVRYGPRAGRPCVRPLLDRDKRHRAQWVLRLCAAACLRQAARPRGHELVSSPQRVVCQQAAGRHVPLELSLPGRNSAASRGVLQNVWGL